YPGPLGRVVATRRPHRLVVLALHQVEQVPPVPPDLPGVHTGGAQRRVQVVRDAGVHPVVGCLLALLEHSVQGDAFHQVSCRRVGVCQVDGGAHRGQVGPPRLSHTWGGTVSAYRATFCCTCSGLLIPSTTDAVAGWRRPCWIASAGSVVPCSAASAAIRRARSSTSAGACW